MTGVCAEQLTFLKSFIGYVNYFKQVCKWTALVWLNAGFSFFLALGRYPLAIDRVAIMCGVFTFVFGYARFDQFLLSAQKQQLRKALLLGVLIKSLCQVYPAMELGIGAASIAFVQWIIKPISFFFAYCITLVDGILLSLIAAVMTCLVNFMLTKFFPTSPQRASDAY